VEIMTVYSENHARFIISLCGNNDDKEFLTVSACRACAYHCALKTCVTEKEENPRNKND
jgi:hypothetical protein